MIGCATNRPSCGIATCREAQAEPEVLKSVNDLLQYKGLLLKAGTVVDATLIAAPSSTKNATGERDPEMKQSKKGPVVFRMKAHNGAGAESGLVHAVRGTAGSVNDVVEANSLLHGQEDEAWADAGYQSADKRLSADPGSLERGPAPGASAGRNQRNARHCAVRRRVCQRVPTGPNVWMYGNRFGTR